MVDIQSLKNRFFGKKTNWVTVASRAFLGLIILIVLCAVCFPRVFVAGRDFLIAVAIAIGFIFFVIATLFVNTDRLSFREHNLHLFAKLLDAEVDRLSMMVAGFYKTRKIILQLSQGKPETLRLWIRPKMVKNRIDQPTAHTYFDGDIIHYYPAGEDQNESQYFQDRKYTAEEWTVIFEELIQAASLIET